MDTEAETGKKNRRKPGGTMLEKLDLSLKIEKQEYKKVTSDLEIRVGALQRKAYELKIPVIVVFEGWDAAGKGTLINKLLLALDPRGYMVHPTNPPTEEEILRPFLWRFWNRTPEAGKIAVFDRSWYGRVLVERVDRIVKKKVWERAYGEIVSFERQLVDGGFVIIKFFLHITKKEQKKRFGKLRKNKSTAWKVTKDDYRHHRQYAQYLEATEDMLARTDTGFAPWTVVEAHDRRYATVKVFNTVTETLARKIDGVEKKHGEPKRKNTPSFQGVNKTSSVLDKTDLSKSITRDEYGEALKEYQKLILELEHEVYLKRVPVVVVYQGWDAAGKGGNIKRLVQKMDPRGYEVVTTAAPNDVERAHHYLWRFWGKVPKAGHIAIFDRSWYGRVLVERVEGFCREDEWRRAYREINEMEEQWVHFGTVLIKFWLHIDKNEQLRRFEERQNTPYKQWKISDEDWRNRQKWDRYKEAVDEMLVRTSTSHAPWTVIESNSKLYARIKVLKTVVKEVQKAL
jgi:polyphosphate kinase 2 (PPK2 family)